MRRILACAVLAILLCSSAAPAAESRVVAVGDVHGEYDGFVSILKRTGLVDDKLRWAGGNATLVQTGDFFDRGADVRKVLDLLMTLESAAPRRRGRVLVLLGNHEVMNLAGILQDLNPAAYAAFADRRSERRRTAAYRQYVQLHERLATRYPAGAVTVMPEAEWMAAHPPGFLEYYESLRRDGRYGRWLRTHSAIAKIGDTVFVHGGLNPKAPPATIEEINSRVRVEVEGLDRIREYLVAQRLILPFFTFAEMAEVAVAESKRGETLSADLRKVVDAVQSLYRWSVMDPEGPLWYRGFAEWNEQDGAANAETLRARFGARRFVVGHTIPRDPSRILQRFGGSIFLIDTGMLRGYAQGGRPSALEIAGDRVTAVYETERATFDTAQRDESRPWLGPNDTRLPFVTAAEVAEFLRRARLVSIDKKPLSGITAPLRLTIEANGVKARAVFRRLHREEENARWESGTFTPFLRDSYRSEIAAYELATLLGVDSVPPTVQWELEGEPGALQLFIEKARAGFHPNEAEKPADPEKWQLALELMRPFDALIANIDRHDGNMLIDSTGKVWWIDHTRSFGRERELPANLELRRCGRMLWRNLRRADPAAIRQRVAPYMSEKEIDALLARRDLLVKRIETLIAEKGEAAVLVDP